MAAATAGYRNIADPPSGRLPNASPPPASDVTTTSSHPAVEGMHTVAKTAAAAAVGAKDAVTQLISAPSPNLNLYTEPLDPSATFTLKDRFQLVFEGCRPWSEFADIRAFNAPPASEAKLRIGHNLEIFFYNYFVVAFVILIFHAIFHPVPAILLALTVAAAALLYIIFPEDYAINDTFSIGKGMKHAFMAALTLLVFTIGHVFSLLFLVVVTFLPLALVHAFLREHSAAAPAAV